MSCHKPLKGPKESVTAFSEHQLSLDLDNVVFILTFYLYQCTAEKTIRQYQQLIFLASVGKDNI